MFRISGNFYIFDLLNISYIKLFTMKKIVFSLFTLLLFAGFTEKTKGQDDKIREDKNEEIVIRKHGDKNAKITVEINGDDILINGKPISDFKDEDITIMKRKSYDNDVYQLFKGPQRHGSLQFWNDEDNEPTAFLGVVTEEADKGVKITKVVKESAAGKAGLQEGDIITKIGSKKISDPDDLVDAVTSYKPKDEVKVYYERNKKSNDVKLTLGEKKVNRVHSFAYNAPQGPVINDRMFKNFNYNTPDITLEPFINTWGNDHKKLGVRIEDTENETGVKITNIEEGSAAEKAGLKKDDIITSVDDKSVKNVGETKEEVRDASDKSSYTVKAKRNGTEMSFEIKVPKKINNADL